MMKMFREVKAKKATRHSSGPGAAPGKSPTGAKLRVDVGETHHQDDVMGVTNKR